MIIQKAIRFYEIFQRITRHFAPAALFRFERAIHMEQWLGPPAIRDVSQLLLESANPSPAIPAQSDFDPVSHYWYR